MNLVPLPTYDVDGMRRIARGANELLDEGAVRGLVMVAILHDGSFTTASAGSISFLEKLGALEAAKADMVAVAENRAVER